MSSNLKFKDVLFSILVGIYSYFAITIMYNLLIPHIWGLPKLTYLQGTALCFFIATARRREDHSNSSVLLGWPVFGFYTFGIAVSWVFNYFLTN